MIPDPYTVFTEVNSTRGGNHQSVTLTSSEAIVCDIRCQCVYILYICLSQQTRDVLPMLAQCWASVVDGGPTLSQHWVNFSCLLGIVHIYVCMCSNPTVQKKCWANI